MNVLYVYMTFDLRWEEWESKDGSALRIAILGAGAMGSIFGVESTSNGVDTLLVDVDGPLINRLNDSCVIIRRAGKEPGDSRSCDARSRSEGPVDVLLVFVKCWATREAMALAQPLLGSKTYVLSLQKERATVRRSRGRLPRIGFSRRDLSQRNYHWPRGRGSHGGRDSYLGPHRGDEMTVARAIAETFTKGGLLTEATPKIVERIGGN